MKIPKHAKSQKGKSKHISLNPHKHFSWFVEKYAILFGPIPCIRIGRRPPLRYRPQHHSVPDNSRPSNLLRCRKPDDRHPLRPPGPGLPRPARPSPSSYRVTLGDGQSTRAEACSGIGRLCSIWWITLPTGCFGGGWNRSGSRITRVMAARVKFDGVLRSRDIKYIRFENVKWCYIVIVSNIKISYVEVLLCFKKKTIL